MSEVEYENKVQELLNSTNENYLSKLQEADKVKIEQYNQRIKKLNNKSINKKLAKEVIKHKSVQNPNREEWTEKGMRRKYGNELYNKWNDYSYKVYGVSYFNAKPGQRSNVRHVVNSREMREV